jgi:hypothetical protein
MLYLFAWTYHNISIWSWYLKYVYSVANAKGTTSVYKYYLNNLCVLKIDPYSLSTLNTYPLLAY